jgi:hypothetical protein
MAAPQAKTGQPTSSSPESARADRVLQMAGPLRDAMFTEHNRAQRKHTTTQLFWTFVAACRDALDRLEAEQAAANPALRCLGS